MSNIQNSKISILAIDPGASGGLAVYSAQNNIALSKLKNVCAFPMPDDVEQLNIVREFGTMDGEKVCYMEQVGGYIKGVEAPGSAMFNFGDGWGYLRGLLAAFQIKLVLVRPQKWQVGIMGAADKAGHKRALKEHAARLFPQLDNITLKTADALCILDYAMKQENLVQFKGANEFLTVDDVERIQKSNSGRIESEKLSRIVATVDLPLKEQYKLAVEWCKKNNWPVPERKTVGWSQMFNYWLANIAPQ